MTFKWNVHYTGSKGNSVSIYTNQFNILVDAGKPYKFIEPLLYEKHFLIFTHRHGDHFKPAVYKKIRENFPNIKILANEEVNNLMFEKTKMGADVVFSDNFQFQIGTMKFTTIQNYHGAGEELVDCHGLIIEDIESGEVLLYATDLSTTIDYQEYLDKNSLQVDYCLLESNYNPLVIEFYESTKAHTGFDIFSNGSYRHLASTEHKEFTEKYCKPGSIVVQLHQSETYSTFEGLIKRTKKDENRLTMEDVEEWKQKNQLT
ncbi:hypothetical protein EF326P1_00043 [Enterococcus phage EF326P1]|nr:hypothetical protein EF326P1_00043 [Enterococcus phage EF326P1]